MRICFLNPFGTPDYDAIIGDVLQTAARPDCTIEVRHLDSPLTDLDYFAAKHIVEVDILKAARAAERDGFDAIVIGCCYDPALTQVREIVTIPVIGPLEASTAMVRPFGHRFAVITDHHKAVGELRDRIRLYGLEANCLGVSSIGWFIDDMIKDPARVGADAYQAVLEVMRTTGAETIIIGCTIVAACYEITARSDNRLAELSVVDPNVLAVKQAELLADLAARGQYRMSRAGYYQPLSAHNPIEAAKLAAVLDS